MGRSVYVSRDRGVTWAVKSQVLVSGVMSILDGGATWAVKSQVLVCKGRHIIMSWPGFPARPVLYHIALLYRCNICCTAVIAAVSL